MQYLTIWDFILTPIYLIILVAIAKRQRDKWYPVGNPLRAYYLKGLYVKFFGAIFIALIYQYYYGGGDTFYFFSHAKVINSSLDKGIGVWLKLALNLSPDNHPEIYPFSSQMEWYEDPSTYTVSVIAAIFGLLNGTTYIPIAVLFAFFSYTGIWAMYRTFYNLYPLLNKELAIAFLFIPSTFVWGSAVFKDTICMFGVGWMTYTTFRIFVNRDFSVRNLLMLMLSFYLVAVIKIYILLAFLPALSMWLLLTYSKKIRNTGLRWIAGLVMIGIVAGGFLIITQQFATELNRYSLEAIAKTSEVTRGWISYASGDEGSAYDLGEIDGTIEGMLLKLPAAVVVTFFRPFPWEVNKVIVALSALEAFIFLALTLKLILIRIRSLRYIFKDPTLLFCLIYSIIFGFAVGISSYNFGALSRYKIPCLPFYGAFLVISLYSEVRQKKYLVENELTLPFHMPSVS